MSDAAKKMTPRQETADLKRRIRVLEQKLDATIRSVHLISASAAPGSRYLDACIEKIDDPAKIGVQHGH